MGHGLLFLILANFALSGCARQIQDYVDRARDEEVPQRRVNFRDDSSPKISPARIEGKGTGLRMQGNMTVTNREIQSGSLRAVITTSRTSTGL